MRNRSSHPSKHGDDSRRQQRQPVVESKRERQQTQQGAASAPAAAVSAKNALQDWDDDIAHLVESSIVTPRTVRASLILVLAMAVALLYNYWEARDVDPSTSTFLQAFCDEPDASCHPRIGPRRRSQQAIASVKRGDTIVTIPRRLMILDVDAMQDPYLQKNWAGKVVRDTKMDAAAYLAVYLSRLLKARKREANRTSSAADDDNDGTSSSKATPPRPSSLLAQYLDVLASANVENHPLALNESFVERHLARTSSLYVWRKHSLTIASEYEQLAEAAPGFKKSISYEEYRTARLLVLTRAFGTGPPPSAPHRSMQSTVEPHSGHDETNHGHEDSSSTKLLRTLEAQFNVDLSMGSYAMVPVLDFYDHHASPNVGFEFKFRGRHGHDDESSSSSRDRHLHQDDNPDRLYADGYFHITALHTISPEATLYDSYGMRTDSDLFARYGFLQGDGTDYTQASLALHSLDFRPFQRRTADVVVKQRGQILRYLQYDDGYLECVNPSDYKDGGNAYELKKLKYLYLLRRADSISSWTVVMHPRKSSSPPKDRDEAKSGYPSYNPLHHPPVANGTSAYTTCRIISLMDTDYDGRAAELLSALANDTGRHSLPPLRRNDNHHPHQQGIRGDGGGTWEDALEYRTLHCMTRLISASLQRLNTTLEEQMVALRHPENQFPNWSWHFGQLKLGEVATLMHLREIVHGHLRNKHERFFTMGNVLGFAVHRNGCPRETLDPLFELYGTGPL